MWISVALIVAVIIVGIIAGKRLSAPGPQRRAVYFAFGTLAVLALWFFIFVAFFPAEWIVPFFTVACIVIPICVYMMVLRSGGKERAKAPSKRSFEIPKKDITVESAKAASAVSSGTASASSATTPSKAATPAPSASQQTAPASSTPSSTAKTDTSSASATKAKAPAATTAVATAPAKPAASEAPKATAKPSAEAPKASAKEAPKPVQAAAKAEAPSTQKSTAESAPVAAPASTKPAESAKSTEPQEAETKPPANKEHVAEIAIEEATEKTPEPPVKAAPATTSPSEDQLREAAEIEILVDRAAEEEAAKIEELVRPFASQATPAMDAEKERELNVGAPVSSPAEEAPTSTEATPAKTSSAPAATPAPAPTPEPTPKPAAKPAPKPAKKEPVDHFAEFSARATALRDQGAYAIAAMLFEEAAALAPNANEARNTHFEELACYVKAGDAAKAKEIAAKLRQSSVLTRFERIKLDAVERMS